MALTLAGKDLFLEVTIRYFYSSGREFSFWNLSANQDDQQCDGPDLPNIEICQFSRRAQLISVVVGTDFGGDRWSLSFSR